jgi:hypothetical protein
MFFTPYVKPLFFVVPYIRPSFRPPLCDPVSATKSFAGFSWKFNTGIKKHLQQEVVKQLRVSWKSVQRQSYFTLGRKLNFLHAFHYSSPILVKFDAHDFHIMAMSNSEFLTNRWSKRLTLSKDVKNSVCVFLTLLKMWMKFGKENFQSTVFSDLGFRENWSSESDTYPKGVHEFISVTSTFIVRFWWNST